MLQLLMAHAAITAVHRKRRGFSFFFFFFKIFIYLFLERGWKEGERKEEKPQFVVAPRVALTGDLACNPGMRPDWESNQQPFGLHAHIQSTELHQAGQ